MLLDPSLTSLQAVRVDGAWTVIATYRGQRVSTSGLERTSSVMRWLETVIRSALLA